MRTTTTYFVDTENIQHEWRSVLEASKPGDQFVILYTVMTPKMPVDLLDRILSSKRKCRTVRSETGHNGLDFTLVTELGRCVEQDAIRDAERANPPARRYVVLSDDQGFDSAVTYLRGVGYNVERKPLYVTISNPEDPPKQKDRKPAKAAEQPTADTAGPGTARDVPSAPVVIASKGALIKEYKNILLKQPLVTKNDASLCAPYIYEALAHHVEKTAIKTAFNNSLVHYYKDGNLAGKVYNRVKPALEAIIEGGPHPSAGKKKK